MKSAVAQLEEAMKIELDYEQEVRNMQEMARLWDGHERVHVRIPRVYEDLCEDTVIAMEFFEDCSTLHSDLPQQTQRVARKDVSS